MIAVHRCAEREKRCARRQLFLQETQPLTAEAAREKVRLLLLLYSSRCMCFIAGGLYILRCCALLLLGTVCTTRPSRASRFSLLGCICFGICLPRTAECGDHIAPLCLTLCAGHLIERLFAYA